MTYKELFLTNLRKKYPLVTTEDQLYECAIKGYHKEHEFAKKCREETDAFARNLHAHPEMAFLMSAFLDPKGETSIDAAFNSMKLDLFRVYGRLIKDDHYNCAQSVENEMFKRMIAKLNKRIHRSCLNNADRYPDDYTVFECIAAEHQRELPYDDISPDLSVLIQDLIEEEYRALAPAEKMVFSYAEATFIDEKIKFPEEKKILFHIFQNWGYMLRKIDLNNRTQSDNSKQGDIEEEEQEQVGTLYKYKEDNTSEELRGFAAVAGLQDLKDKLKSDIVDIIRAPERAKALKLSLPNGFLLYGPPGCGKTYFAQKLAEEMKCSFMYVDCADLSTPYIHGAQGKIGKLFTEAEKIAPCIVFLDEVDALIAKRENHHNVHTSGEVNVFLTRLNNCGKKGIIVIGATNKPLDIDPAALRSGRLENKYYFPLPDMETRSSIFAIHLHGVAINGVIEVNKLADLTEGYVSADIEKIVDDAKRIANRNEQDYLMMDTLEKAIKEMKPSVSKEVIKQHETIRDKFEGRKQEFNRIGFC